MRWYLSIFHVLLKHRYMLNCHHKSAFFRINVECFESKYFSERGPSNSTKTFKTGVPRQTTSSKLSRRISPLTVTDRNLRTIDLKMSFLSTENRTGPAILIKSKLFLENGGTRTNKRRNRNRPKDSRFHRRTSARFGHWEDAPIFFGIPRPSSD